VASDLIDIQNHTYDLHSPPGVNHVDGIPVNQGVLSLSGEPIEAYVKRLTHDLRILNALIKYHLNTTSQYFYYPYGAHDELTEAIIKYMGFKGSFLASPGIKYYDSPDDLFSIPRLTIPFDLTGKEFLSAIDNLAVQE